MLHSGTAQCQSETHDRRVPLHALAHAGCSGNAAKQSCARAEFWDVASSVKSVFAAFAGEALSFPRLVMPLADEPATAANIQSRRTMTRIGDRTAVVAQISWRRSRHGPDFDFPDRLPT